MEPALRDGDWVIVDRRAYRVRVPRAGEVVVASDPRLPAREVVKRVGHYGDEGAWLQGDNPGASTDSRAFGYVRAELLLGRVAWRYWPPSRAGPVR
jgi:nickel-type superoxide dismutase maturation protease